MAVRLPPFDQEIPAIEGYTHLAARQATANGGDSRRTGTSPTSLRNSRSALPNAHPKMVFSLNTYVFNIRTLRKKRVMFYFRPQFIHSYIRDFLTEMYTMGISHGYGNRITFKRQM